MVDTLKVIARYLKRNTDTRSGAQENGIEPAGQQFIHGDILANLGVHDKTNAHGLEHTHLFIDDVLG